MKIKLLATLINTSILTSIPVIAIAQTSDGQNQFGSSETVIYGSSAGFINQGGQLGGTKNGLVVGSNALDGPKTILPGRVVPGLMPDPLSIYNSGLIVRPSGASTPDSAGLAIINAQVDGNVVNDKQGFIRGYATGILVTTLDMNNRTILHKDIINSGTIEADNIGIDLRANANRIINKGTITGKTASIKLDEAQIPEGVINYGILNGSVFLDGVAEDKSDLTLLSATDAIVSTPQVNGVIQAKNLTIGDNTHKTAFVHSAGFVVSKLVKINAGSSLTLAGNMNSTANATENYGTLNLGSPTDVNRSLTSPIVNFGIINGPVFSRRPLTIMSSPSGETQTPEVNGQLEVESVSIGGPDSPTHFTQNGNGVIFSALTIAKGSELTLNAANTWSSETVDNNGIISLKETSGAPASYNLGELETKLTNSGTLDLTGKSGVGHVLTLHGDYAGNNGLIKLNTALGDDYSKTDKLQIIGKASGTTHVQINNLGGKGDQTVEGISVIETLGSSADAFKQQGRIVAGSYDYTLQKGNANGDFKDNWYLTSKSNGSVTPPVDPDDDDDTNTDSGKTKPQVDGNKKPTTTDNGKVTPTGKGGKVIPTGVQHVYRPEGQSYAQNLQAANTLFSMVLHDREGQSEYIDPITGEHHVTSLWLRTTGGHRQSRMSDGQTKGQANRYLIQMGGDVMQWSGNGADGYHLGVMAGYGNEHNNSHNRISHYGAKGEIHGYSTGIYGTWYQHEQDKSGPYVDSWMLYNWFDNSVKGDGLSSESYKSRGITASVETGYAAKVAEFGNQNALHSMLWVQPQAQLTWMGVRADGHREVNGTHVQALGEDNLQSRLGVRTYLDMRAGKGKESAIYKPFVEANWLHNTEQFGVKMDGQHTRLEGSRNAAELKTGLEVQVTDRVSLWGNVGQQIGSHSFSDTQGTLGGKVSF